MGNNLTSRFLIGTQTYKEGLIDGSGGIIFPKLFDLQLARKMSALDANASLDQCVYTLNRVGVVTSTGRPYLVSLQSNQAGMMSCTLPTQAKSGHFYRQPDLPWVSESSIAAVRPPARRSGKPMGGTGAWVLEKIGGLGRNRTGVHGFAVRCVTTPPPGHPDAARPRRGRTLGGPLP